MEDPIDEKILIRVITGECSIEERRRVEKWVEENPEHKKELRELRQAWELSGDVKFEQNEDEVWKKISQRISGPTNFKLHRLDNFKERRTSEEDSRDTVLPDKKYSKTWFGRIAAACLLILSVTYLLYNYGIGVEENTSPNMKEIVSDRGEHTHLSLEDGTSVVLNASSTIRFPESFNAESREVELEGEAFFSVARKEKKPFLVHTKEATVQVLGTKFNVNAYADYNKVEVVVEDGRVAVRAAEPKDTNVDSSISGGEASSREVILEKGEHTLVASGSAPTAPRTVTLDHHLGWINGDLIFEGTPLNVVLNKLELYYDRDFEVADPSLFDRKLTASFRKESLSKVLDVLSIALDLKYEQRDSLIYLESEK